MERLLACFCVYAGLSLLPVPVSALELAAGHEVSVGAELGYVRVSGHPAWTSGAFGKLRYDDDGFRFNRGFADYRGRLTDTLNANLVLEAYDDDIGAVVDFTEAYLEWRPVPRSATRYRLRAGMFYPRLSLENTDPGWSSPYTLNSSAINAWVAEEIRTTGIDLAVSHRPAGLGGKHTFAANLSVFGGNDPAGSLLAWKGWSVHDRQTRPGDDLPLPPIPELLPGGVFGHQDPYAEPLLELDDAIGYFASFEWRMARTLLVRLSRYDNEADPAVLERGQYGWYTEFSHVGVQARLPGDLGLFLQWMGGSTVMGPFLGEWHPVDTEYEAAYLMLTRAVGPHRVTVRYDDFSVTDNDELPNDDNNEDGNAWTLAYQYRVNDWATLAVEWFEIRTSRPAWAYFDVGTTATERQAQIAVRLRF